MRKKQPVYQKVSREAQKVKNAQTVKVFGVRMKYAREELCKYSQVEAARRLGYANSSKLAKIEGATDTVSVPFWIIVAAADLYQVSIDWLFGFGDMDDWERDPEIVKERMVTKALFNFMEQTRAREFNMFNTLGMRHRIVEKAVSVWHRRTKDLKSLVHRIREINPLFDTDIKLGSKLLQMAIEIEEEAQGIDVKLKRYHAFVEVAEKGQGISLKTKDFDHMATIDMFENVDEYY